MQPKISAACFIRDNQVGAFCLWESLCTFLPLVDEYVILDFGSTDGTLELLFRLAKQNPKIKVHQRKFAEGEIAREREKIFATMANEVIGLCQFDVILYHQADEIAHEDLIPKIQAELEKPIGEDWRGLSFIRYQLQENFQRMKWLPHVVKRFGLKKDFLFVGDGMNAEKYGDGILVGDVPMCEWETLYKERYTEIPSNMMLLDVSMTGGFLENIEMRRKLHAPLWGESAEILYGVDGGSANLKEWMMRQRNNPNWTKRSSPFNIPAVMMGLVGETKYKARGELLAKIARM